MFEKGVEDNDEELEEYAKVDEESDEDDEESTGRCFVTTTPTAPMTAKMRDLLLSFNIPSNSYHSMFCEFDKTCSYTNELLVSMSSEVENSKTSLYEAHDRLEEMKTKIESLELYIKNIMCDMDTLRMDNKILIKQRNIYGNAAKRLYGKLTYVYHSAEICVEQHRKLFAFITFK